MPRACAAVFLAALVFSASCAGTRFERSWSAPGLRQQPFRNFVVIAITNDHERRVTMEDAVVSQIRTASEGLSAEPSYKSLNDADAQDGQRFRDLLATSDFDGAIVLRLTNTNEHGAWLPGYNVVAPTYYRTIWSYYDYWRPIAFQPGYLADKRNLHVETAVYEVPEGDLVYAVMSQALDPASASDISKHVGERVAKDLREKGLVLSLPRN